LALSQDQPLRGSRSRTVLQHTGSNAKIQAASL
jgi:hypothetical protein